MRDSQPRSYTVSASVDTTISPAAADVPDWRAQHTPGRGSLTTVTPRALATPAVPSVLLLSTTMIS
jgi:hypothetical protein